MTATTILQMSFGFVVGILAFWLLDWEGRR